MLTVNRVHKLFNALHGTHWDSPFAWPETESAGSNRPRVWAGEQGVIFEVDLPGRDLADLEVSTDQNRLTVEAKRGLYNSQQDHLFRSRERTDGSAQTEFRLPFHIQADLTDVVYQQGVLRITLRKPAEEQPRKLNVRG